MAKYLGPAFLVDVRNVVLTGLSVVTNAAITAADSIVSALGKLQAQITAEISRATTAEALLAPKVNPNFTGVVANTTANGGVELGSTTSPNTPYLDFHSSGNNIDFDVRFIAAGGNATAGQGVLSLLSPQFTISNANAATGGANLLLAGDGSTPNKYIRSSGGQLQIINSANSKYIMMLSDSGSLGYLTGLSSAAMFFPDPSTIDPSGVTDSASGIQAAITACANAGGGRVFLPQGVFKVNSTLVINKSGVQLWGAGHGAFHDVTPLIQSSTLLVWGGAVGGVMFTVGPTVSASSQKLTGIAVRDLALQGSANFTTAGAAYGLVVTSTQHSEFDLYTIEFTVAAVAFTVVATAIAEAANCEGNIIRLRFRQQNQAGTALQLGGSSQGNTCFNTIELIYGYLNNGIGIDFADCDNNIVIRAWLDRIVGGTGTNVYFRSDANQPGGVGACARVNVILELSGSIHTNQIYVEGFERANTATAAYANRIERWDNSNQPINVVWGTGTTDRFFYGLNTSPIAMRESVLGAFDGHLQHSNGTIDFWGTTGSLAAGTSGVQLPFGCALIRNVMAGPYTGGPVGTVSAINWSSRSDGITNKFDIFTQSGGICTYRGVASALNG